MNAKIVFDIIAENMCERIMDRFSLFDMFSNWFQCIHSVYRADWHYTLNGGFSYVEIEFGVYKHWLAD